MYELTGFSFRRVDFRLDLRGNLPECILISMKLLWIIYQREYPGVDNKLSVTSKQVPEAIVLLPAF